MADKKISQLTGASTPLAGTEVLPIVQSNATVKVSVANLTAGRAVSAQSIATTGASAVGTSIDSSVGFLIVDSTNASYAITARASDQSAARIRIKNTGTGGGDYAFVAGENNVGQTGLTLLSVGGSTLWALDDGSGNIAQKVAAKGVNFTANTPAAGMTSQLLNWYEEGTFTPTYGGSTTNPTVTYSEQVGRYTRIGRVVTIGIRLVVTSATGGSGNLIVNGLPFTGLANTGGLSLQFVLGFASNVLQPALSGTSLILYDTYAGTSNTQSPVSALTSAGGTTYLVLGGTYMV